MGRRRRWLASFVVFATATLTLPACLARPANTSRISLVSSMVQNGWQYDFYENRAYRCAESGFQTFMVGTRVGSSATDTAPLWVWMHGGDVGWFDASGTPQPDASFLTEEVAVDEPPTGKAALLPQITQPGLLALVHDPPSPLPQFRILAVSYCDRDLYAGTGQSDTNNPNLNLDGSVHATHGLLATEAAIQFVQSHEATSAYFLQGGSAGSAGAYDAAYALQLNGNPPAGVVSDAGVVNLEGAAAADQQYPACVNPAFGGTGDRAAISARLDPALADSNNEIDKLVARGEFRVPLLHIWNTGDPTTCADQLMSCPLRDNTVVTMAATDCIHEPLRQAIAALGPGSASENLPVCISFTGGNSCSVHVVTNRDPATVHLRNGDYATFLDEIMTWVCGRLQLTGCGT